MSDITMCSPWSGCSVKETCYRYKAIPNMDWQSWADFSTPNVGSGQLQCDSYIPICEKYCECVKASN